MVRACGVSMEDMGQHVQKFEMLREMKWTREGREGRSGVRLAQWPVANDQTKGHQSNATAS